MGSKALPRQRRIISATVTVLSLGHTSSGTKKDLELQSSKEHSHEQTPTCQGPPNGGVSNGGVSRSGLVLPFLSFFVLFGTFPIFPGFSRFGRGWSGDFPDLSFSSFSAYEEHLRGTVPKGSATQSGPFPKKVGNTRVWKPPGLASLKLGKPTEKESASKPGSQRVPQQTHYGAH